MFEDSHVSKKIYNYFSLRIGQYKAPVGLSKVLTIHSAGSSFPRLLLMDTCPSRQFKSVTTKLAMRMSDKEMYISLSGDETIHSLEEDYGTNFDQKCLVADDWNHLFKAMASKSKARELTALAQLYSEGRYHYGGKGIGSFTLTGRISLLINLPSPAYYRHQNELFESTLGDRMFIVHSWLTEDEVLRCKENYERSKGLKSGVLMTEHYNRTIKNLNEYKDELLAYAKDYAILSERSVGETLDIVKAIASENARVNRRNYICKDDITLVRMLRAYCPDPMSPERPKVLAFLKEGRSYKDICHLLKKDPKKFYPIITYYKKRWLMRGALDVS